MYDVKVQAIRKGRMIHVTIFGNLANTCLAARIVDQYPGGGIVYFVDPGSAQVFIKEYASTDSPSCLQILVPWAGHVNIFDPHHENVDVFINNDLVLENVPVETGPSAERFKVIALVGSTPEHPVGCSIVPANALYPMIYGQVFGPASKEECEKWVKQHCVAIPGLDR